MRFVLLIAAVTTITAESPAVGSVNGQLVLIERPGTGRADIATAVVYLQPLDARGVDDRASNAESEATIVMRGREFMPHSVIIRRGGIVKFPNEDPFSHNVFSNMDPVSFDLGLYRRGATRSASFGEIGVFPIYCNIHARMVSYVISVPGRHFAFADSNGAFSLPDVPVGRYRLSVWHERAARMTQDLVVTAAGATVQLSLDARGYVPGAHLNKFGMPYSNTRSDRY